MGRHSLELDQEVLLDMSHRGFTQKEMSEELEVSIPTIAKTIITLRTDQGLILKYRDLESLRVTALKHDLIQELEERLIAATMSNDEILKGIAVMQRADKDKVGDAPIDGLIGHLMEIQKQKADEAKARVDFQRASIDV